MIGLNLMQLFFDRFKFWSVLFSFHLFACNELGVTYDFSGGRFGDNLISYIHAKWMAYEKNIPLIYKPFQYSDQLLLDEQEVHFDELPSETFSLQFLNDPPSKGIDLPILYICPYFPEDRSELEAHPDEWFSFRVNYRDPFFKSALQKMIAPKEKLSLLFPPPHSVSIALHLREGGRFDEKIDLKNGSLKNPMKFPPLSFYAEGIKTVLNRFNHRKIYCYIFTDAKEPEKLVKKLKALLPKKQNILFDYRQNESQENVLEDFFSMMNFDVLIRPASNFSIAASIIHDFAFLYAPRKYKLEQDQVIITDVFVEDRTHLYSW